MTGLSRGRPDSWHALLVCMTWSKGIRPHKCSRRWQSSRQPFHAHAQAVRYSRVLGVLQGPCFAEQRHLWCLCLRRVEAAGALHQRTRHCQPGGQRGRRGLQHLECRELLAACRILDTQDVSKGSLAELGGDLEPVGRSTGRAAVGVEGVPSAGPKRSQCLAQQPMLAIGLRPGDAECTKRRDFTGPRGAHAPVQNAPCPELLGVQLLEVVGLQSRSS